MLMGTTTASNCGFECLYSTTQTDTEGVDMADTRPCLSTSLCLITSQPDFPISPSQPPPHPHPLLPSPLRGSSRASSCILHPCVIWPIWKGGNNRDKCRPAAESPPTDTLHASLHMYGALILKQIPRLRTTSSRPLQGVLGVTWRWGGGVWQWCRLAAAVV